MDCNRVPAMAHQKFNRKESDKNEYNKSKSG